MPLLFFSLSRENDLAFMPAAIRVNRKKEPVRFMAQAKG